MLEAAWWTWQRRFSVDYVQIRRRYELAFNHEWELFVLPDLLCLGGRVVVSDGDLIPWADCCGQPAPVGADSSEDDAQKTDDERPEGLSLAERLPWIVELIGEDTLGDGKRAIGGRKRRRAEWGELDDSAEEGDSGDDVPLEDADVEAVFDILQAKRKEWEVDAPD